MKGNKMNNRTKEFEFLCGDEVWFRDHKNEKDYIRKGIITRVSLTQRGKSWHYNLEASFEDCNWYKNDGSMTTGGVYLINTDEKKQAFRTLEELQNYYETN
jgi:hypothetical protein